jgi:hypothetical protein
MTGAWRLKNDGIPKPALPQVRELRLNRKSVSFSASGLHTTPYQARNTSSGILILYKTI